MFWNPTFFGPKILLGPKFFLTLSFWTTFFWTKIFWTYSFYPNLLDPTLFSLCFGHQFFGPTNIFPQLCFNKIKTTTLMGFNTFEINLDSSSVSRAQLVWHSLLSLLPRSGSILDSQKNWESGKFQLARWSHEVVLFPDLDHPPTPHPPTAKLFLSMLCGVPTPIVPPINKVCAVSPLPSFYVVRCPHPMCYPCQQSMCGVPPSQYTFFLCGVPPNVVFFHSGSVLDSKQNWESGKFQFAR